jgi:hypothetical protein
MKHEIITLANTTINHLNYIYEFRAFSKLSYKIFGEAVDQGSQVTALIPLCLL